MSIFIMVSTSVSIASLQWIIGLLLLVTAIKNMLAKSIHFNLYSILPWMRELLDYEAKKLGHEFKKIRWTQIAAQLFIAVLLFAQSIFMNHLIPPLTFSLEQSVRIMVPSIFVMIVSINIAMIYHMRKVDKGTAHSLKGFNVKSIAMGLVIGIPAAVVNIGIQSMILWSK